MKQEECICPDCQKCSGSDNAQTISQNVEVNVQNQNVQSSENEQNVLVEENEQQEQQEQNVAVQQDECICPDCKKTEIATD